MIKRCKKCEGWDRVRVAAYQDKRYGKGKRVHNELKGGLLIRCTVCGNTRDIGGERR